MKILLTIILLLALSTQQYHNYSNSQALKYLYYSKTSYCEKENILARNCETCGYNSMKDLWVVTNSKFKSLSIVGYNPSDNTIFAAFRGTDNVRNWFTNLNALRKDYDKCEGCKVHRGFSNIWEGQSELVLKNIANLKKKYSSASIVVTGHSLGGAIATLCAVDVANMGYKVKDLYTFGAPRVGNDLFSYYVSASVYNSYRVVRKKDPVPHVPAGLQGYQHHVPEYFYNEKDYPMIYSSCNIAKDKNCSYQYSLISAMFNIDDHLSYLGYNTNCNNDIALQMSLDDDEEQNDIVIEENMLEQEVVFDMDIDEEELEEQIHFFDSEHFDKTMWDSMSAEEWEFDHSYYGMAYNFFANLI